MRKEIRRLLEGKKPERLMYKPDADNSLKEPHPECDLCEKYGCIPVEEKRPGGNDAD